MRSSDVDQSTSPGLPERSLRLVHVACGLCAADDPEPVAIGEDFEYRTSAETFLIVRCRACGLLYLNPRPAGVQAEETVVEREPVVGAAFSPPNVAARMRSRFEARRLVRYFRSLPTRARVLDLSCGDGTELALLREFAPRDARFEGFERNRAAADAAQMRGFNVRHGALAEADLPQRSYDLVLARRTLESSGNPGALLVQIRRALRPGGLLIAETGNAGSPGRRLFGDRYWGGYRFPHAWNLFTHGTVERLARSNGMRVESVATRVSPLAWIYSIRNALLDARAPGWLVACFSRRAPVTLVLFTVVDAVACLAGGGSLLYVTLERPPL